ncbi:RNA polymerase sigma factor [Flavobacterium sp. JP2137]|uniref:RNA polymerase sigma factor n=1 Tax=Flavobacterium sp. JP2137 TaxID=3414510 RepID=UPI003D2FE24F
MNPRTNAEIDKLTHHLFRENSGKMMGILSKVFGVQHIDVIADAVQDTFETAIVRWRFSGLPENPTAWLIKVAKNKAINAIKRHEKWDNKPLMEREDFACHANWEYTDAQIIDAQLQLLLLCCKPGLSKKNQIAISLHILCGFGVSEISNALLMTEEAVKKAITRIKSQWKKSLLLQGESIYGATTSLVENQNDDKPIQEILYLMFNEGYKATKGKKGINIDLCFEAIRLSKLLLMREKFHFETRSLLALMFFDIARFPARISPQGEWLTMEEQDRSLWNKTYIEEGFHYLQNDALPKVLNAYYIEALLASLHCTAGHFENTAWKSIVFLYQQLEILKPNNFIVKFNRIIAESFLGSAEQSLLKLSQCSPGEINKREFIFYSGQAYLYVKIDDKKSAKQYYQQALVFAKTKMDQNFIKRRITELTSKPTDE